jgi:hypothetical protein
VESNPFFKFSFVSITLSVPTDNNIFFIDTFGQEHNINLG